MDGMFGQMISFAATGGIGGFRLGMSAEEADRLLGGDTGLAVPGRSASDGMVGFKGGSLEVWVGFDATVRLLGLDAVDTDGRFATPARTGAAAQESIEAVGRADLINGLGQLGCGWSHEAALSFDDQLAIRTDADVTVVFTRPDPPATGWLVASLYGSADGG